MSTLEDEFRNDMVAYAKRSKDMLGYPPARVYQMLQEYGQQYGTEQGAVETARQLIMKPNTTGLTDLAYHGSEGLKISIEWLVVQPKYQALFRPEEIALARQTLIDHGLPAQEIP